MSLSHQHTPVTGNCSCRSEKYDKVSYHKRYRRAVRIAVQRGDEVLPHFRELSNVWTWGKDGKTYWVGPIWLPVYKVFGK